MTKRSYEEEAMKLSKAIDIAIESFEKHPREIWSKETLAHIISCYREWKDEALNPKPESRKVISLKHIINDVLTLFQESNGKDVEYFWERIKANNLDYIREDKLGKIIKRGKIKNRIEFDYVSDLIVAAEQENRITKSDAKKLAEMVGEYKLGSRK